jgi:hypothetical protein
MQLELAICQLKIKKDCFRNYFQLYSKYFKIILFYYLSGISIILFLPVNYVICNTYIPPIGIPIPEFGIEETVEAIYGANYYTHYIDNTHPDATDNSNPNGTSDKPRKTIPKYLLNLAEGSVVVIHGGPYSYSTPPRWTSKGTREKPVFIRGADPDNKVFITKTLIQAGGTYLILENLELYKNSRITISYSSPHHVSFRNCEIHNPIGYICSFGAALHVKGEDIVVYNNHIHHNWRGDDIDCWGVGPGVDAKRVWILDNHIHHHSGDAVLACHLCDPPPQYVYIGRNVMHEDRENAVDLKYASDVVISQNVMYGYRNASTSDGSAVILGSDGGPNRPWVIFNEIYDCDNGIRNEETDTAWIMGNNIYDIKGFAIGLEKKSDDLYIIGNTVYDVNVSIDQLWQESFRLHIFNNIFSNIRKDLVHLDIGSQNIADESEMSNNLFWQNGDPVIIRWASGNLKTYHSTSDFEGFAGGDNNIIGNPLFEDPLNSNFALNQNSSAIDAGIIHKAYDTYFDLHGVDIKYDFLGKHRPQGLGWDLGAFEYIENAIIPQKQLDIPVDYYLSNYPNPFNPSTTILFSTPNTSKIKLDILNIHGQIIITLINNVYHTGTYRIGWTGIDQKNLNVVSGVYFCRSIMNEQILLTKMLLVR